MGLALGLFTLLGMVNVCHFQRNQLKRFSTIILRVIIMLNLFQKNSKNLFLLGGIVKVNKSELAVCSPLGVVCNGFGKPRLFMDLWYVNKHLRVTKFKYEDIRTACDLFMKGDWFFKLDYKSGYTTMWIYFQTIRSFRDALGDLTDSVDILSLWFSLLAWKLHPFCLQKSRKL